MSNVKKIDITGIVPFDIAEKPEAQPFWAAFAAPNLNLNITYSNQGFVPNTEIDPHTPHPTGKTQIYSFALSGYEAIAWGWFDKFYQVVERYGGKIKTKNVIDPEDQR